jgi:hypothetical protein
MPRATGRSKRRLSPSTCPKARSRRSSSTALPRCFGGCAGQRRSRPASCACRARFFKGSAAPARRPSKRKRARGGRRKFRFPRRRSRRHAKHSGFSRRVSLNATGRLGARHRDQLLAARQPGRRDGRSAQPIRVRPLAPARANNLCFADAQASVGKLSNGFVPRAPGDRQGVGGASPLR